MLKAKMVLATNKASLLKADAEDDLNNGLQAYITCDKHISLLQNLRRDMDIYEDRVDINGDIPYNMIVDDDKEKYHRIVTGITTSIFAATSTMICLCEIISRGNKRMLAVQLMLSVTDDAYIAADAISEFSSIHETIDIVKAVKIAADALTNSTYTAAFVDSQVTLTHNIALKLFEEIERTENSISSLQLFFDNKLQKHLVDDCVKSNYTNHSNYYVNYMNNECTFCGSYFDNDDTYCFTCNNIRT